jgi:glyoxylase-like metal-dependent hydrolase (beta-lactamase superfamily II)
MKIFPLSEGTFTVDKTKHFIPFDKAKDKLHSRTQGSLLVEIQPFAVITSTDILLLDTGLGFSDEKGNLQIHQNLKSSGIDPMSVTKVLLTHLHKDHAGGIETEMKGEKKLSFPQAKYYVQKKELEFAFEKGSPSFVTNELEVLKNSSQVVMLENDKGTINDFIDYEVTAAHSPYHQVFWIKENDETIFFGGDDAPQLQQMKHRFVAKYDYNGKKASQLRQQWWEQGKKEKWTFLFYHDIQTPIYTNKS